MKTVYLAALLSVGACLAAAQEKPGFSGHWEGVAKVPNQESKFTVDLAKNEKGVWSGSFAMGAAKGIPLSDIVPTDKSITFRIPVPNGPVFEGKLAEDGSTITGESKQGGATVPFELKRVGDAKVDVPPKSSQLAQNLEGSWEGTLTTPGGTLRLVLKLSRAADGTASGILDSLDQNVSLPVDTITLDGANLSFELRVVNGTFTGKFNDAMTEVVGEWGQAGTKFPLTLKKKQG